MCLQSTKYLGRKNSIMIRETSKNTDNFTATVRSAWAVAVLASLSMASVSAHASCADMISGAPSGEAHVPPTILQQLHNEKRFDNAAENIVGTWHVIYAANGAVYAQAFIQWHRDRTEWENISKPVAGGNICMGSWKPIDANHVFRNHYGWIFDDAGSASNYFNETETDEVSRNGLSYEGVNTTKIYSLTGTLLLEIDGTAKATRIEP
jgi:hypothetical protein